MSKSETFKFKAIPTSVTEMSALSQTNLENPFEVAAMVVLALCHYPANSKVTIDMLNSIKGAKPFSTYDKQFLQDRFRGKDYIALSYFEGASVENNYTPTQPYTITISDNKYSYDEAEYVTLFAKSAGADSPRQIKLRKKGSQWLLWEQFLLSDIRKPAKLSDW